MTTQMEYATVPEMLILRMCSSAEPVHSNLTDIEQKKREYNANQFLTHHIRFLFPLLPRQDINASTQNIHHSALMKKRNSSRNTNTVISEVVRF